MTVIAGSAKEKLLKDGGSTEFVTKLIVQGLLMLLEKDVKVRCRKVDESKVQGCLQGAQAEYSKIVKAETGKEMSVALKIDDQSLPPAPSGGDGASCLGGVMLICAGGKITIDNTIDSRLALVMEQAKPNIRDLLFPQK